MEIKEEEIELWKDIPLYENYQVSSLGNVKSLKFGKEKMMKQSISNNGYCQVHLCKEGKSKTYLVHRLVAQAFLDNSDNLPQVNHKDENKQNNTIENLEYCTAKYNINYGDSLKKRIRTNVKNGIYDKIGKINKKNFSKPINQYTKEGIFIKKWDCIMDVQRELGFDNRQISNCLKHRQKTAKGYVWQYADFYETKKAS